ncbi:hypothetical protein BDZ90DRAFT_233214 [Jaminaea rosea]|uniref:Uncharacterized protein n=1 Tax=Jaminaea rosea TaxID=1569628 RepID=A0A316UU28_9BASI|nr:hypothetical protein BDZ90DRAFT_233214 [Jaminaea rosea]PWN26605.1 hypothetical protein BDZ90DRAFT_233214 [Jaminaea rosea]
MVSLAGPVVPNRLRLAAQGTPVLSTIESIGSPSEPSDTESSAAATPTEATTPRPYSAEWEPTYLKGDATVKQPSSPTLLASSAHPNLSRRTSLAAGWSLSVRRPKTVAGSFDSDAATSRGHGQGATDGTYEDSEDEDDLWGTPVDADAIAMGLVEPPSAAQQQTPNHRRSTSANVSSDRASIKSKSSVKTSSPLRTHMTLPPSSSVDSVASLSKSKPNQQHQHQRHELLDKAGLSLECSADPLREVRDRNLGDLKLLLAKSIQRKCDRCPPAGANVTPGFGLWVWTWTSELLCSTCLADVVRKVPEELQVTLVERSARCHGVKEAGEFRAKQVDFDMLARIANALPKEALKDLDAVNQEKKPKKSPTSRQGDNDVASGSAFGIDFDESSARPSTPSFAARQRLFKSKALRKAMHRLAKKSMPLLARSAASAAALPPQKTPPKLAPPPLPLTANEEKGQEPPRKSAPPQLVDELDKTALTSPEMGESFSADSAPAAPDGRNGSASASPSPPSSAKQPHSPSPTTATFTTEEAQAIFRHASSVFVGIIALEETQQWRPDPDSQDGVGSRGTLIPTLHAVLDPLLICTYCLATRDHDKGRVIVASDTGKHFALFHGGARPGKGLVDYVLHEGIAARPRFPGEEPVREENKADGEKSSDSQVSGRRRIKAWEEDDDLQGASSSEEADEATSIASDPTQDGGGGGAEALLRPTAMQRQHSLRKASSQPALRSLALQQRDEAEEDGEDDDAMTEYGSVSGEAAPLARPSVRRAPNSITGDLTYTVNTTSGSADGANSSNPITYGTTNSADGSVIFTGTQLRRALDRSSTSSWSFHDSSQGVGSSLSGGTNGSGEVATGLPSSDSSGSMWSRGSAVSGGGDATLEHNQAEAEGSVEPAEEAGESFISADTSESEGESEGDGEVIGAPDSDEDPVEERANVAAEQGDEDEDPVQEDAAFESASPTLGPQQEDSAPATPRNPSPARLAFDLDANTAPPLSSSPLVADGAVSFFPPPVRPPRSPRRGEGQSLPLL